MSRDVIHTADAPAAIGPYSQAIRTGQWLFTAGQIGLSPDTGQLVAGGVESETRQALANLRAVLKSAGSDLAAVVKTTVFILDFADFEVMNRVYAEHFTESPPARSTVAVAGLPRQARVEIEAVAALE